MPDGKVCPEQFRGWLLKWTNYIKGYQRRWFVLANGLLSYYRYGIAFVVIVCVLWGASFTLDLVVAAGHRKKWHTHAGEPST